jgi:hypothetical protein
LSVAPAGANAPRLGAWPRRDEREIVTPEELERERQASRERRKKAADARRVEQESERPTPSTGLSRSQRQKLREDEYVPPQD